MPTWGFSTYHTSPPSSDPALSRTFSKRRAQQLRRAQQEDADTPSTTYHTSDTPFPRKSEPDDVPHNKHGEEYRAHDTTAPQAFTHQRTVRRKKSSLDLRDLFLNDGTSPSRTPSTSSDGAEA
ncbi:hypothetical protein BD413DRAFT_615036 [Trametes elegans]|nr:hypothetical protein BD413DRAFT_615036 [Trametes elegans]